MLVWNVGASMDGKVEILLRSMMLLLCFGLFDVMDSWVVISISHVI
jgi:hypothetical protein